MKQPLKRHQHLRPLSREHHFGLLCCWKIRQGIRADVAPERIAAYISYFWASFLSGHFRDEEQHLFNDAHDLMIAAAVKEHAELEAMVLCIHDARSSISLEQVADFANSLDDHIRFEERFLFPYLELRLDDEKLSALGAYMAQHSKPTDDYQDEFWITHN